MPDTCALSSFRPGGRAGSACLIVALLALAMAVGCGHPQQEWGVTIVHTIEHPPELVVKAAPVYPELAREKGVEGDVLVAMVVDTLGKVGEVQILRGPQILHAAARDAAFKMEFVPARDDGVPIPYKVIQRVSFRLDEIETGEAILPLWRAGEKPRLMNEWVLRGKGGPPITDGRGDLLVEAVLGTNGRVERMELLMGSLDVFEAAREIALKTRYTAARLNRRPIRVGLIALLSIFRSHMDITILNRDQPLYSYGTVDTKPIFLGEDVPETKTEPGIRVGMMVDTSGSVEVAWIVSGPAELREPALRIARAARFIPARHEGRPVRVWLARRIATTSP